MTDSGSAVFSVDCEVSFHLPSWSSCAVRGAEEAPLSLPVYNPSYASVSIIMSFCESPDCCNPSKLLFKVCRWIFLRPFSLAGVQ